MEDTSCDSTTNVCIDPIERMMQELDSITTLSDTSSQPAPPPPITELPHRPIVLPAKIKEEPIDKRKESSLSTVVVPAPCEDNSNNQINTTEPVESTTNNIEGHSTIAAETASNVTATQNKIHTPQIQIKQERRETDFETPTQIMHKDCDGSATNNEHERDNEDQIHTSTVVTSIKSEPVETDVNATQINVLPPTSSQGVDRECVTNNQSTATLSATVSTSSPGVENVEHEHDEALPDNFFDDLIRDADNITAAALQAKAPVSVPIENETNQTVLNIKSEPSDTYSSGDKCVVASNVKSEPLDTETMPEAASSAPIPENFFDDLLVDHVSERVEDLVNHNLEIKYSERLKELQELEKAKQHSSKAHKKHKKKKKKSHKRSHDELLEEGEVIDDNHKRSKRTSISRSPTIPARITVKKEFSLSPAPKEIIDLDSDEPETSTSAANRTSTQKRKPSIRIKSEFATFSQPIDEPDICLPLKETEVFQRRSNCNRNGLIMNTTMPLGFKRIKLEKDVDQTAATSTDFISIKDKIQNAKQRAIEAIDELNNMNKKDRTTLSAFIHTTTVRKLPNSSSYIHQKIYDNRSPLHNVNNVQYKFNSHASRFNLHEWGLEEMPSQAAKVAKILGFDVDTLTKKLQTVKMPPKLLKIKKENMKQEEQMREPQSSFLLTVATQTDDVTVLDATSKRQKSGFDVGVQAAPQANSIGTQTIDLPVASSNSYQDLPLVRKLGTLNENQLLALSEFADIIREPPLPNNDNAIDSYRQYQRIIDLYKWSQRPSAHEQTKQESQPVSTQSIRSNNQILRDPRLERMVPTVQAPMLPSIPNPRDPRRMPVPDSPPPPPPKRHLHAAHSTQPYHPNSYLPQTKADSAPQKIPVITNVQSIHPDGLLPPPPPRDVREELSGKYFGRGSIRR